ncbi:MAG: DNA polymerase III subunit delta' C-terminal domain-containing protein [Candidatus Eisenbacteria bacterium]
MIEAMRRAIADGVLAHAYLLLGPRGSGRGRLATALAQLLLCPRPDAPCGACPDCKQARKLAHPDLHLLAPATKEEERDPERFARLLEGYAADRYELFGANPTAQIGIDQVRALKEDLAKARVSGPRRIGVLLEAGRLGEAAGQSALKLVEEPPPDTVLFLCAEETSSLLPTLVSRCQRLRVRPLPRADLARVLAKELDVPEAEARLLASLSGGSLGRAIEMREDGLLELRDRVLPLFEETSQAKGAEAGLSRVASAFDAASGQRAVELLLLWHRDLLAARQGLPAEAWVHADRATEIARIAATLSLAEIRRRIELLEELNDALSHRVNPELSLHAALARWKSGARAGELWP